MQTVWHQKITHCFVFFSPLCRTICVLLERNRGYVPIYVPNCIAISSYHQCLKFMIFYGANIICFHFASSLPLSFFPFSHFCMAFLTKKKIGKQKENIFFYMLPQLHNNNSIPYKQYDFWPSIGQHCF